MVLMDCLQYIPIHSNQGHLVMADSLHASRTSITNTCNTELQRLSGPIGYTYYTVQGDPLKLVKSFNYLKHKFNTQHQCQYLSSV